MVFKTYTTAEDGVLYAGASTEGEVDATCVQIGLRGEENYTLKGGRIPPDIWVICKCNL